MTPIAVNLKNIDHPGGDQLINDSRLLNSASSNCRLLQIRSRTRSKIGGIVNGEVRPGDKPKIGGWIISSAQCSLKFTAAKNDSCCLLSAC